MLDIIIIIRQENAILKKELAKAEKINKLNDILKKDYLSKINNLQNENIRLKKKIKELQKSKYKKKKKNKKKSYKWKNEEKQRKKI